MDQTCSPGCRPSATTWSWIRASGYAARRPGACPSAWVSRRFLVDGLTVGAPRPPSALAPKYVSSSAEKIRVVTFHRHQEIQPPDRIIFIVVDFRFSTPGNATIGVSHGLSLSNSRQMKSGRISLVYQMTKEIGIRPSGYPRGSPSNGHCGFVRSSAALAGFGPASVKRPSNEHGGKFVRYINLLTVSMERRQGLERFAVK